MPSHCPLQKEYALKRADYCKPREFQRIHFLRAGCDGFIAGSFIQYIHRRAPRWFSDVSKF